MLETFNRRKPMKDQNETNLLRSIWRPVLVVGCLLVGSLIVAACSSFKTNTRPLGKANVNMILSDLATCAAPDGPLSHVYVTISDVQANVSGAAGDNDGGWVDLTPSLSNAPKQVDLLGQVNKQRTLALLGDDSAFQAETYHQIRMILADDRASTSANACGSAANCVMLSSDSSVHALQLASESTTGIRTPSGQIASGAFTIAQEQTGDLDIDFDTCDSITPESSGQYLLKPVLHVGEVSTTSSFDQRKSAE
jgi:hypothetical protein